MAGDAPPWIAALKLCSQAITEYGLQKQWQSAVGLLAAVREEGIPPDLTLYRKTLNACRESGRWMECMHALRYLRHVQRQGLRAGAVLYGATMASASGLESSTSGVSFTVQWHRAVHVLHGMREDDAKTDAASWRIVISATGQAAHWMCAAQMLSEMRRESLDTGAEAYTGVMLAALNRDVWPAVLSLFRDLRREGGALSTAVFNAAMLATDLAGPSGPRRALRLLRAVQRLGAAEPNVLSVTMAMMAADAADQVAGWRRATRILQDARCCGVEPNRVAYTALAGLQEQAERWQLAQCLFGDAQAARVTFDSAGYRTALRVAIGPGAMFDLTPSKGWKGSVPPLPLPRMKMPEPNKNIEQVAPAIAFSMHLHHTESALRALEFRHLDTVLYFA
ncbi:unnamed protein product, partial [Effrenium voratum]